MGNELLLGRNSGRCQDCVVNVKWVTQFGLRDDRVDEVCGIVVVAEEVFGAVGFVVSVGREVGEEAPGISGCVVDAGNGLLLPSGYVKCSAVDLASGSCDYVFDSHYSSPDVCAGAAVTATAGGAPGAGYTGAVVPNSGESGIEGIVSRSPGQCPISGGEGPVENGSPGLSPNSYRGDSNA
jgi:hypothetical protein